MQQGRARFACLARRAVTVEYARHHTSRVPDLLAPQTAASPTSLLSATAAKTAAGASKNAPGASKTPLATSIRASQASPQSAPRPKNRAQASPEAPRHHFDMRRSRFAHQLEHRETTYDDLKARRHRWRMMSGRLALTASRTKTTPHCLNSIDAHIPRLATASRREPHK